MTKKLIALFAALMLLVPIAGADGVAVIELTGDAAHITGSGARWEDGSVIITEGGDYEISGAGKSRIVVDAKGCRVTLTLRGAEISCPDSAAIFVRRADQVTICVPEGEEAILSDGSEYRFDDEWSNGEKGVPGGCVYADCDLSITGGGALTVRGNCRAGVLGKDEVEIRDISLTIESSGDGIRGKDGLTIAGAVMIGTESETGKGLVSSGAIQIKSGSITVDSGDDAIHAETIGIAGGELVLSTLDDAIHADGTLSISGGNVHVLSGYEGLEAETILISGGTVRIRALDDGINATGDEEAGKAGFLRISGGDIRVNADGDGVDVNGDMEMTGGTLLISGPSDARNGALDFDGTSLLSGGTLLAVGNSAMARTPASALQPVLICTFPASLPAGSVIFIAGQGAEYAIRLEKDADHLVFSAPELTPGEYEIRVGDAFPGEEGELLAQGCAEGGELAARVTAVLD